MKTFIAVCILFAANLASASKGYPIEFGVYKLKGTNPDGVKRYTGKIVIQREGANYRVTWFIGPDALQAQVGIGILEDKVLSIGYMDASGDDFGVVSMKVINSKTLKGKWASIFSQGTFGEEEFIFEKEEVPQNLKPKPVKTKNDKTI